MPDKLSLLSFVLGEIRSLLALLSCLKLEDEEKRSALIPVEGLFPASFHTSSDNHESVTEEILLKLREA